MEHFFCSMEMETKSQELFIKYSTVYIFSHSVGSSKNFTTVSIPLSIKEYMFTRKWKSLDYNHQPILRLTQTTDQLTENDKIEKCARCQGQYDDVFNLD